MFLHESLFFYKFANKYLRKKQMSKQKNNFPFTVVQFLKELKNNNNKDWFENNRELFNELFLAPALQFVVDLGEELKKISPEINAVPKIDKSIFRLHRDVRFSKDKSPFKTNMGLYFWEGKKKRMECSGFYFHAEPGLYFMGTGMYMFDKNSMAKYRAAVYDLQKGKALNAIVKKIEKKYEVKGEHFKKIPRGFDPEYPYAYLLKYNSIYTFYESKNMDDLYKGDAVKIATKFFKETVALHNWLTKELQ